jgi:histidinol-phosphate aminotransferase
MSRSMTSYVRSCLTPTAGYTPGASELTDKPVVRLDWNESPYGLSPKAQHTLVSFRNSNRYPDFQQGRLRAALSRYIGVGPERIVPGAGLDDVFNTLAMLLIEPNDEIVIADPTFGMYRSLYALHDGVVRNVPLGPGPDFALDVEGIIDAVTDRTKLVIVCNPNNPTGHLFPAEDIRRVVDGVPCLVGIDEAYAEFSGTDHLHLANSRDNVILFRTLSKFAGLAGLRVGYGIFPESLVPFVATVTPAFGNISTLASEIAISSLDDLEYLTSNRDAIVSERERVRTELASFPGVTPFASATNFILFALPVDDSSSVQQALAGHDIFVRRFGKPEFGLEHCLRVTISTPDENNAFLAALDAVLAAQPAAR